MAHRLLTLFLATFVVTILVGCNQSSVAPEESDTDSDDAESECAVDGQCDSYNRCIDGDCATPPAMSGAATADTPVARIYDGDEVVARFYLELAISADEQRQGLMYRPSMLDDWGMLFIYDDDQELSFWMKNTLIPLDMIFVDATGEVVGVVHEAEPETTTPRNVGEPARYVLEINGGLAAKAGIDRGTTMSLEHVEESHQPTQ